MGNCIEGISKLEDKDLDKLGLEKMFKGLSNYMNLLVISEKTTTFINPNKENHVVITEIELGKMIDPEASIYKCMLSYNICQRFKFPVSVHEKIVNQVKRYNEKCEEEEVCKSENCPHIKVSEVKQEDNSSFENMLFYLQASLSRVRLIKGSKFKLEVGLGGKEREFIVNIITCLGFEIEGFDKGLGEVLENEEIKSPPPYLHQAVL